MPRTVLGTLEVPRKYLLTESSPSEFCGLCPRNTPPSCCCSSHSGSPAGLLPSLDPQASSLAGPPAIYTPRSGDVASKPKSDHIRLLPSPAGRNGCILPPGFQASPSPSAAARRACWSSAIWRAQARCPAHLCAQGTAQDPISIGRKYVHWANLPAS